MVLKSFRNLLAHALPVLVAQLASVGMMVVDTVVLGHFSAVDLAAVGIGGAINISLLYALVGVLQAVTPMVAHSVGAGEHATVTHILRQGLWLALLLSVPGVLLLRNCGMILALFPMDPAVAGRIEIYLGILACGLPAYLFYRTFCAFSNALGRARLLMLIGLLTCAGHAVLAWGLGLQGWLLEPLGAKGCALSNVLVSWMACGAAFLALQLGSVEARYRVFSAWEWPCWATWRELLRLGLPLGVIGFIEMTAFTLDSLLLAPLGATVVASHRIIGNLAALCYMLPLALAIATLSAVGRAVGARDWRQAHVHIGAGLTLAAGLSSVFGLLIWLSRRPLVDLFSDDPAVRSIATGLVIYIAVYQFFDALQTVASHVLRAYRVTFVPMLVQILAFWGVGLGLGWWLCYHADPPLGVAGFWSAAVLSLTLAAVLLCTLLWKVVNLVERD